MLGIDHEYIPEDALQGDVPGSRPDVRTVYCEVMQMGACKLDANGLERAVLNLTVRAHRLHTIPVWLTRMTGMTEERRSRGVSFPEALQRLVAFVGEATNVWTFNGDWWVLEGNAKAHGIELPFATPFKRLKPLLPGLGIHLADFQRAGFGEVCSGGLHRVLGIELPHTEGVGAHDATHDARSLAYAVHQLGLGDVP